MVMVVREVKVNLELQQLWRGNGFWRLRYWMMARSLMRWNLQVRLVRGLRGMNGGRVQERRETLRRISKSFTTFEHSTGLSEFISQLKTPLCWLIKLAQYASEPISAFCHGGRTTGCRGWSLWIQSRL